MNIIKLSDNIGELEAVRDKASEELQYLRSLDTAGDGKWFTLNSVRFKVYGILNKAFHLPKWNWKHLIFKAQIKSSLLC